MSRGPKFSAADQAEIERGLSAAVANDRHTQPMLPTDVCNLCERPRSEHTESDNYPVFLDCPEPNWQIAHPVSNFDPVEFVAAPIPGPTVAPELIEPVELKPDPQCPQPAPAFEPINEPSIAEQEFRRNFNIQIRVDHDSSAARKATPLFSGCLNYFPDALLAVARLSKLGNDKRNPGQPLHWSKGKSADHADCLARHLLAHGTIDPDTGFSHTVAVAWRALALLQTELEGGR